MKENKIELQLFARRPNIKPYDETITQTNSLIKELEEGGYYHKEGYAYSANE